MVYDTEADLVEILDTVEWDVRILGDEYKDKDFTGRDKYLDKCYFNKRPHTFSSSELRERVAEKEAKKILNQFFLYSLHICHKVTV